MNWSPTSPDVGNSEVGRLRTPYTTQSKKPPVHTWDERRLRLAVPPKLVIYMTHFAPTNIGISNNVENTACTTRYRKIDLAVRSRERLKRELQLGSDERNFQRA